MVDFKHSDEIFNAFTTPLEDEKSTTDTLFINIEQIYCAIDSSLALNKVTNRNYFINALKNKIATEFNLTDHNHNSENLKLASKKLINLCIIIDQLDSNKNYYFTPEQDLMSLEPKSMDQFLDSIWKFEQDNTDERDIKSHHLVLTTISKCQFNEIKPDYTLKEKYFIGLTNLARISSKAEEHVLQDVFKKTSKNKSDAYCKQLANEFILTRDTNTAMQTDFQSLEDGEKTEVIDRIEFLQTLYLNKDLCGIEINLRIKIIDLVLLDHKIQKNNAVDEKNNAEQEPNILTPSLPLTLEAQELILCNKAKTMLNDPLIQEIFSRPRLLNNIFKCNSYQHNKTNFNILSSLQNIFERIS